jgi:Flp pilus assembly protein TadB
MITGLLLGAGMGFGAFIVARALMGRAVPLAVALAALDRPSVVHTAGETSGRWHGRAGRQARSLCQALGVALEARQPDLRIAGRTAEQLAFDKLMALVAGVATPVLTALVAAAGGTMLPVPVVVVVALGLGGAGFVVPDALLRSAAAAKRDGFRHALSAYLDLVNVLLAGAAGMETALEAAAEAGDGWVFAELRTALDRARVLRESPWDAFARLGAELGVQELVELAASVRLAGEQGARIKASLAAKAASLRGHQLARAEAAAHAASERMAVPNVLMFLGFLAFVGYPALVSIIGGV